jgi:ABC-2 type transport system permease protein
MTNLAPSRRTAETARRVLAQLRGDHPGPGRPPAPPDRGADGEVPPLVSARVVAATARRVLAQLRADRRTVALLLVVPSVLLILLNQVFDNAGAAFDRVALLLLGIFPFTMMFLITSVAMLRERTSGTLERLLTTPASKLDLLLGYGIAFALAATAQALVTCATAYGLLGIETPGSPSLVVVIVVITGVLGMAIGLLCSAFATSEFQAVQFMPAVIMPQILLCGLFVPREQMAEWLQTISDALPLTYVADALGEVGSTSLVTDTLLRDIGIVLGSAIVALTLAASTLRRQTPAARPGGGRRRALLAVPVVAVILGAILAAGYLVDAGRYVSTDNAQVDGDQIALVAPVSGTLVDWRATQGSALRKDQPVGRIQIQGGFVQPQMVIRAPADGTVAVNDAVQGAFVTAGTRLAVAYDLADIHVTARVDQAAIGAVRVGQLAEVTVDAYAGQRLSGYVSEIQGGTAAAFQPLQANPTADSSDVTQVVPVKIAITDRRDLPLVPGMNVSVKIHKS